MTDPLTLIHGDCVEVMRGMGPESVDAIVTDPPYGLGFMGKEGVGMNTSCHACNALIHVDLERVVGIRYCEKCRTRADATWRLRTAALYVERAGLEVEAQQLNAIADRIALPGSFTRKRVLGGGLKRPRRAA